MANETLWSEFLRRLLLGATLAAPVPPSPPPPDTAPRLGLPEAAQLGET